MTPVMNKLDLDQLEMVTGGAGLRPTPNTGTKYSESWWKQFRAAVDGGDDTKAGRNLDMIRTTLGISAGLGVLTIISAVTGPYW